MNWQDIIKEDMDEAMIAQALATLRDSMKSAPKYVRTAIDEIERYAMKQVISCLHIRFLLPHFGIS